MQPFWLICWFPANMQKLRWCSAAVVGCGRNRCQIINSIACCQLARCWAGSLYVYTPSVFQNFLKAGLYYVVSTTCSITDDCWQKWHCYTCLHACVVCSLLYCSWHCLAGTRLYVSVVGWPWPTFPWLLLPFQFLPGVPAQLCSLVCMLQ